MARIKSTETLGLKAALPAANEIGRARQLLTDVTPADARIEHHDQPCPSHLARPRVSRARQCLQHRALFRSQSKMGVHVPYETTEINVTGR